MKVISIKNNTIILNLIGYVTNVNKINGLKFTHNRSSNHFKNSFIFSFIFIITFVHSSCKKEDNKVEEIPIIESIRMSHINHRDADFEGLVVSDGGHTITSKGACWSTRLDPTILDSKTNEGAGAGEIYSSITGLIANTVYYIRAYAINEKGIGYGNTLSFETDKASLPSVSTDSIKHPTQDGISAYGAVQFDGGTDITEQGFCWSLNENPTTHDTKVNTMTGIGTYNYKISGLMPNKTYYLRAFASNIVGTSYGEEYNFNTLGQIGYVTDIDGNTYKTISIGNQVWMVENLKTTKFKNGESIPKVESNTAWANSYVGSAYCNYNNEINNVEEYGQLYNWFAINDNRCIAPEGWHVASVDEWLILIEYLGGSEVAGGAMKETGIQHWLTPNTGATNVSGFTGLPGGMRVFNGTYSNLNFSGDFWTSTETSSTEAKGFRLYYESKGITIGDINDGSNKKYGFSVRCIKD